MWPTGPVPARTVEGSVRRQGGSAGLDDDPGACAGRRLIVNTTSLGMQGQPPLAVDLSGVETDDRRHGHRLHAASHADSLKMPKNRCQTVDGLGMLLHQAVPGFERWFSYTPTVDDELRARFCHDADDHRADRVDRDGQIHDGGDVRRARHAGLGRGRRRAPHLRRRRSGRPALVGYRPSAVGDDGSVVRKLRAARGRPRSPERRSRRAFIRSSRGTGPHSSMRIARPISSSSTFPCCSKPAGFDVSWTVIVVVSTSAEEQRSRVLSNAPEWTKRLSNALLARQPPIVKNARAPTSSFGPMTLRPPAPTWNTC
jgi:hypothetical protein